MSMTSLRQPATSAQRLMLPFIGKSKLLFENLSFVTLQAVRLLQRLQDQIESSIDVHADDTTLCSFLFGRIFNARTLAGNARGHARIVRALCARGCAQAFCDPRLLKIAVVIGGFGEAYCWRNLRCGRHSGPRKKLQMNAFPRSRQMRANGRSNCLKSRNTTIFEVFQLRITFIS